MSFSLAERRPRRADLRPGRLRAAARRVKPGAPQQL